MMTRGLWTPLCAAALAASLLSGCGGSAGAAAMLRDAPPPLEAPTRAETAEETLEYAVATVDWEDSVQAEDGVELAWTETS